MKDRTIFVKKIHSNINLVEMISFNVNKCVKFALSLIISVMIIVVLFGVVNRFLFKLPISWTEEIARFLMVWTCMLGSTIAIKNGTHVAITYFISKVNIKIKDRIEILNHVLIILFLLIPTIFGIKLCLSQAGQLSPATRISMFWPFLSVPLCCLIMILHEVVLIKHTFGHMVSKGLD